MNAGGNFMNAEIIAAIITASAAVVAAIIAGCFSLIRKKKANDSEINITQTQSGKNNTQIGIQNNHIENLNNTTIKIGSDSDNNLEDINGTLIIDCGNASGDGGGIRFEPKKVHTEEEKNDGDR